MIFCQYLRLECEFIPRKFYLKNLSNDILKDESIFAYSETVIWTQS